VAQQHQSGVKTLKDFTDKDRIALPAVRVSMQAVILQMAAEKEFGAGQQHKLDPWTVSLSHPDGLAQMMSGKSEITAHFTSAPFMYQELGGQARPPGPQQLRCVRRRPHVQRRLGDGETL
jgi:NitT/TauT family transport system substrate-binding protein